MREMRERGKCKYYKTCGNSLNCSRCNGFEKDIACKKCSWKDKCEGNKQQCRVDVFIDDFCKKCDFWNTESLICMFGELDCDDQDRRKCREFLGLKG